MGGNVVILDIQEKPVEEYKTLSENFGAKTKYIKTNVMVEAELNDSFAKAIEFLGSLDGLVPCAGIAIDKPFTEQTWDEMTKIQELNVSRIRSREITLTNPGTRSLLLCPIGCKADAEARKGW